MILFPDRPTPCLCSHRTLLPRPPLLRIFPCLLCVTPLRPCHTRPLRLRPISQLQRHIHQLNMDCSVLPRRPCPPLIRPLCLLPCLPPCPIFRSLLCVPLRCQRLLRAIGVLSWLRLRRRRAPPPSLAWCCPWIWSLSLLEGGVKRAVLLRKALLLTVSW